MRRDELEVREHRREGIVDLVADPRRERTDLRHPIGGRRARLEHRAIRELGGQVSVGLDQLGGPLADDLLELELAGPQGLADALVLVEERVLAARQITYPPGAHPEPDPDEDPRRLGRPEAIAVPDGLHQRDVQRDQADAADDPTAQPEQPGDHDDRDDRE